MSIEFTRDPNVLPEPIRARWNVRKGTNGAPEILLDLYQGKRKICRAQIVMGSIDACRPLSQALLELHKKEAPNHSSIVQPGSQAYNTILKAI